MEKQKQSQENNQNVNHIESREMFTMERRRLGKTKLLVTPLCWGCGPLGNLPDAFGYEVSPDQAVRTLLAAFKGPVNFFDTANNYGQSESRIGEGIKINGGLPKDCIIETKADRDPITNEFSALRMRQSVEESLRRLGMAQLPLVYLHDPEYHPKYSSNRPLAIQEILAEGGAVAELEKLKNEGIIQHLGISGGPIDLLVDFVETGKFDVVITHNRWNLIYQTAEPLFVAAQKREVGIVNAAPFASGILSGGAQQQRFVYKVPSEEILKRVQKIKEACQQYGVPVAAAALQFSLREPRISSTVVGVSDPKQIEENLSLLKIPIPDELWVDLKTLANTEGDPEGH